MWPFLSGNCNAKSKNVDFHEHDLTAAINGQTKHNSFSDIYQHIYIQNIPASMDEVHHLSQNNAISPCTI